MLIFFLNFCKVLHSITLELIDSYKKQNLSGLEFESAHCTLILTTQVVGLTTTIITEKSTTLSVDFNEFSVDFEVTTGKWSNQLILAMERN